MPKKAGTGIIIGRYQVLELNKIHKKLIRGLLKKHLGLHIFVGSNPAPSDINPLDWEFRWEMLLETFRDNLDVHEMPDLPDDRIWSQELDRRILELKPEGAVTLYGTQENFINRYSGRYKTEVFEFGLDMVSEDMMVSAIRSGRDFRGGIIYGTLRRFPTVYPTVDIALFRKDFTELLLARKANETGFRFPGGFVDPEDESYEDAAMRELGEECGDLEVQELTYLGSAKVDDWRYRGSMDAVMTHLYACELLEGEPAANDDISEVRWFEVAKLREELFVMEHRPLFPILLSFLEEEV